MNKYVALSSVVTNALFCLKLNVGGAVVNSLDSSLSSCSAAPRLMSALGIPYIKRYTRHFTSRVLSCGSKCERTFKFSRVGKLSSVRSRCEHYSNVL